MRTWNLSTATLRSVAASFSISVVAAAAAAGGEPAPHPHAVAALEMEAELARTSAIYLVIDPARRVLEVRARAAVLDRVAVEGIEVVVYRPFFSTLEAPMPELPATWRVKNGPGDTDREIIAPSELKPYSSGEEEEEEPAAPPTPRPTGPAPTPTPVPEPPVHYRCQMENGWDLLITDQLPPRGLTARFAAAVRDGLLRLRGAAASPPPALALAVAHDDARRLHHLMRSGTSILLLPVN